MKDFDKIKEKKQGDDVKSTLVIIFVFLIIFGIIAYVIVNLTGQYMELKNKLKEANAGGQNNELSSPDEGKKIEYALKGDKINVEEIKREKDNESTEDTILAKVKTTSENVSKVTENKPESTQEKSPAKVIVPDQNKSGQNKKVQPQNVSVPEKKEEQKAVTERKTVENAQDIPSNKGNYLVQLMSLNNEEDAKNAVSKYKSELKDIFYTKADLGEKGIWFRVRCCSSSTIDEANSKLSEISDKLKIKGIVVKQ